MDSQVVMFLAQWAEAYLHDHLVWTRDWTHHTEQCGIPHGRHPSNVRQENYNSNGKLCVVRLHVIGDVFMFVYQMWTVKEGLVHVLDRVVCIFNMNWPLMYYPSTICQTSFSCKVYTKTHVQLTTILPSVTTPN